MTKIFKQSTSILFLGLLFFIFAVLQVDAYVNVSGYYRSDGTYVQPHVRSEPNGLKYDNWAPQGSTNRSKSTSLFETK